MRFGRTATGLLWVFLEGCCLVGTHDVVIRNGMIYDGSGRPPARGDVVIDADRIAAVVPSAGCRGRVDIDACGLAVAPGFINRLSWANESLIADGRSQSDIRQGVTLEVLGEGRSMGPLTEEMKQELRRRQEDVRYEIAWTTLGEYLEWLERRGISCNVTSFVGATTVRVHEIGYENRPPTPQELERMRQLVRQAMEEGAVGVSSSLIYVPACFAGTDELVALAEVAAAYDGLYISHIRSEGARIFEAIDEFLTIARKARVRAEIYHIKVSGRDNWHKMDRVFEIIEAAQAEGLAVTADMYTYHASATGLDAVMPSWVQEGGHEAWVRRLRDPEIRQRVRAEMRFPKGDTDVGLRSVGSAANVLLVGFRNPALRHLTGKSLADVAAMRGRSPEDTAMDLVIEDDSRVGAVFFSMSEEHVRKEIRRPWISFCSDSASLAPEGAFLNRNPHPRAYGSFARLLGRYVRDEKLIPLEEAIRRLTSFPAENLRLAARGRLAPGYYADLVVFDPATVRDLATFEQPHRYAVGVRDVFVNGVAVLRAGRHTGARPGRFVRGPGYRGPR